MFFFFCVDASGFNHMLVSWDCGAKISHSAFSHLYIEILLCYSSDGGKFCHGGRCETPLTGGKYCHVGKGRDTVHRSETEKSGDANHIGGRDIYC